VTPSPESTTTPVWSPVATESEVSSASLGGERAPQRRTLSVESQDGLDGNVDSSKLVVLKHDLAHLLAILGGVHWRLGEEYLAAGSVHLELLLESVVPEVLHVVPVLDNTVLHGLSELQVGAVLGGEIADHDVGDVLSLGGGAALLGTKDGTSDDGREDMGGEICSVKSWSVVLSERGEC
jgi:hypothetical protein